MSDAEAQERDLPYRPDGVAPFLSVADPELCKLGHEAWTDDASMQVLIDTLLERGLIREQSPAEGFDGPDDALYLLEAAAREWAVDLYADFELRITGAYPDVDFIVWRNSLKHAQDATLHQRVEFRPGVWAQPRLLRSAREKSAEGDVKR